MARVEVEGLSKRYADGGALAVRDVTLAVEDGELLVLVGPSGCGKSSILRMLAGLEEATSGEIRIDGARVNDVAPRDRDVAMVFQNYALYPHMSVYENMAFGLKLRKFSAAEIAERVRETGRFLGLTDLLDRKPRQLSGGERQRVALGRALVRRPRLFLFDEPLSNLDAQLRVQMRAEIARLHTQIGATMIYVTHDQVEAMTLGQRIAVLKGGELQQVDAPRALYDRPVNRFVAGFLGSPAMNFLPAVRSSDGASLEVGGETLRLANGLAGGARQDATGPLTLGIRPEHVQLGAGKWGTLPGVLAVRELLGNEILLHADTAAGLVVVRAAPDTPGEVGDAIALAPDMSRAHLFDAASGTAVA